MLGSKVDEAGADGLADEVLGGGVGALLGHLDLQLAGAKAKVHHLVAAGLALAIAVRGDGVPAGAVVRLDAGIVLPDLVPARDANVDLPFSDKGGDVGGGEEDEGDGKVLDEGDVKAVLAAELDVGALEEVQRGGVQASLCAGGRKGPVSSCRVRAGRMAPRQMRHLLLGTAKRRRPSRLSTLISSTIPLSMLRVCVGGASRYGKGWGGRPTS